jgi:hypothetical protein
VNEATLIKTLDLPFGQEFVIYADANILALSPRLDREGRERALDEACREWRRETLRLVPGAAGVLAGVVGVAAAVAGHAHTVAALI